MRRLEQLKLAHVDADQACALHQRQIGGQGGNGAAGEAHHQVTAPPTQRPERRLEQRPAHRIEDNVRAMTAGQGFQPIAPPVRRRIQAIVSASRQGEGALVLGRPDSNHSRAQHPAQLHRRQTDSAGGAEDKQGFAMG